MDYKDESMWLMQGDCLERMKEIPDRSVDMVLTDPPYGIVSCKWDSIIPLELMWEQLKRVIKPNGAIVLFGAGLFTVDLISSNRKDFKYNLIWKKNVPTGMSSAKYRPMKYYENITVFYEKPPIYNPIMKPRVGVGKACYNYDHYCGDSNHIQLEKVKKRYDPDWVQPSDILEFNVVPNRKGKLHPTQKPLALMECLIKTYTNEGEMVLDFTAGSFTTGVACVNTNRKGIMIEKDPHYFEVGSERVKMALSEKV